MTTDITTRSNIETDAIDLLIDQWRSQPDFLKLVSIFLEEIQEIENELEPLQSSLILNTAVGAALRQLGRVVGVREALPDEELRLKMLVQIRIDRSRGEVIDVFELIWLILPGTSLTVRDSYPAGYTVIVLEPIDLNLLGLLSATNEKSRSAGVRFRWITASSRPAGTRFKLSGVATVTNAATGFGSTVTPGGGGTTLTTRQP